MTVTEVDKFKKFMYCLVQKTKKIEAVFVWYPFWVFWPLGRWWDSISFRAALFPFRCYV